MMRRSCSTWSCLTGLAFWLASCSNHDSSSDEGSDDFVGTGGLFPDGVEIPGTSGGSGGTAPTVIGETEITRFRPPVISGDYLWSANPQSGKVALIHAPTLATRVLSAGLQPTVLAAVPSETHDASAIVINEGTSDASFFRVSEFEVTQARIPLHVGANRWAISPTGRHAVAWSGSDGGLDPTNGLQEITIIDLADERPSGQRLSIGFLPLTVSFDENETHAIVTAQAGISIVNLDTHDTAWVPIVGGENRDISITKDGRHALVRRAEVSTVEIIPLDGSDEQLSIEFPGPPTDLDVAPSGRAVAVLRQQEMVATFLVDDILADPTAYETVSLPGQTVGSAELTEDGLTAVLYTNAFDNSFVSVVHLEEGDGFLTHSTFDTQTAVESVTVSPSGNHAVVRARTTPGSNAGAFTILSLSERRFPRILGTGAPIQQVDLHDEIGLVTASHALVHEAHLITLASLQVDVIPLASAPSSAGILPVLGMGFAAQEHPEGRITFFDFSNLEAATLTGFELSSEAVQE